MPVIKSAKKKLRQDRKKEKKNEHIKKGLSNLIKKARKNPTESAYAKVSQAVDRAAKNHIIHKNKAAHIKSALAKLLPKKSPPAGSAPVKTAPKKSPAKKK